MSSLGQWSGMGLCQLSNQKSRSISAENPNGAKGGGAMTEAAPDGPSRELGRGWKCRPSINIPAGQTTVLADIDGPGMLQSMWMTGYTGRDFILRIYWDGQEHPSVETPMSDFFSMHWSDGNGIFDGPLVHVNSLPVAVNPNKGMNCFWEMPFRKHCRVTLENTHPKDAKTLYYQINYCLGDVPENAAYFSCPVSKSQSSRIPAAICNPRWCACPGALCRHDDGMGHKQQFVVGRRRN